MKKFWKESWLKKLGELLLTFGMIAAVVSICDLLFAINCSKSTTFDWTSICGWMFAVTFSNAAALDWTSLAILAAALAALGANFQVLAKNNAEKIEKLSRFYLDSCVLAYKKASRLLKNGNNLRDNWTRAGNILVDAKVLEEKVTEKEHRHALKVHILSYQKIFADALSKPAPFFYGVPLDKYGNSLDMLWKINLDEAAKWSSTWDAHTKKHSFARCNWISERSLRSVWIAARLLSAYPQHDPLKGQKFSKEEADKILQKNVLLYEYLAHKERWTTFAGSLRLRENTGEVRFDWLRLYPDTKD